MTNSIRSRLTLSEAFPRSLLHQQLTRCAKDAHRHCCGSGSRVQWRKRWTSLDGKTDFCLVHTSSTVIPRSANGQTVRRSNGTENKPVWTVSITHNGLRSFYIFNKITIRKSRSFYCGLNHAMFAEYLNPVDTHSMLMLSVPCLTRKTRSILIFSEWNLKNLSS